MPNSRERALFHFSPSVEAYYKNDKVRSAVNLIVDQGLVFAPESNEWDQVETYYDAVVSALQTQVDLAKDMFRLWMAVWGDYPRDWKPLPADPKDEELSLDPQLRWDGEYFERHFTRSGRTIKLWVMPGEEPDALGKTEIAFDVTHGARSLLKKGLAWPASRAGWRFSDGAMRLKSGVGYADGLDLTSFKAAATEALAFLKEFEG
ncbi:hypothetical protein Q9Q95_21000 [Sphingomonas sp. DG1-23]|uniref:hypothetical protein n=1 Tax=Sphingomonas sp. DG1-23 TaxID=3068316 RepID=UPI00273E0866|nr:hypothetical protein [Sphingomonas sp. DG1-23]MDP5281417.1 hypothetical protein [Sphingomonas sp. DG1-23]